MGCQAAAFVGSVVAPISALNAGHGRHDLNECSAWIRSRPSTEGHHLWDWPKVTVYWIAIGETSHPEADQPRNTQSKWVAATFVLEPLIVHGCRTGGLLNIGPTFRAAMLRPICMSSSPRTRLRLRQSPCRWSSRSHGAGHGKRVRVARMDSQRQLSDAAPKVASATMIGTRMASNAIF